MSKSRRLSPLRVAASVAVCMAMALSSLATFGDYEDCPQVTTKIIDCPGETKKDCDRLVIIPKPPFLVCDPLTYVKINPQKLTSKPNGKNETNVQTDTDQADMVTCWEKGPCIADILNPGKCKAFGITADHRVSPLEEVECEP